MFQGWQNSPSSLDLLHQREIQTSILKIFHTEMFYYHCLDDSFFFLDDSLNNVVPPNICVFSSFKHVNIS